MSLEDDGALLPRNVPQADRAVPAARGNEPSIGRERDTAHTAFMAPAYGHPPQPGRSSPHREVPHAHAAVAAPRGQHPPVRRKRQRSDTSPVPPESGDLLPGGNL